MIRSSYSNTKRWIFTAILLFGIGIVFGLAAPAGITSLLAEDIAALAELGDL